MNSPKVNWPVLKASSSGMKNQTGKDNAHGHRKVSATPPMVPRASKVSTGPVQKPRSKGKSKMAIRPSWSSLAGNCERT